MTPTGVDYSKADSLKLIPYVLYGDPADVTADARGGPQQPEAVSGAAVQPGDRQRLGAAEDLVKLGGPLLSEILSDIRREAMGSQADEGVGEPVQPAADLPTDQVAQDGGTSRGGDDG